MIDDSKQQAHGDPNDVAAVTRLDHAWNQAYVKGDRSVLQDILSDDFVAVAPAGQLVSKSQLMQPPPESALEVRFSEGWVRCWGATATSCGRILRADSEHDDRASLHARVRQACRALAGGCCSSCAAARSRTSASAGSGSCVIGLIPVAGTATGSRVQAAGTLFGCQPLPCISVRSVGQLRYVVLEGSEGLVNAKLEGVHLQGAQLAGANLKGADLYWALLFTANLRGANLEWAVMRGADLKSADLEGANLRNADLSRDNVGGGTSLEGANLLGTDLRWTKLDGATYDESTVFPDGFDPASAGMRLTGPTAPSQLRRRRRAT